MVWVTTDNCSEGYRKSNDLEKCKAFYGNFEWTLNGGVSPPISCCLPKPGSCEFSEIVGEGKPYRNIFDSDNDLQRLRTMNMNQLRRINYQVEEHLLLKGLNPKILWLVIIRERV